MDEFSDVQWLLWVAVGLVAGILEVASLDFVFAMVAGGALVTAVGAAFGLSFVSQVIMFAVVSAVLLVTVRPGLRRWAVRNAPFVPTNVHALAGQRATALSEVNETGGTVKLAGETWTARADRPGVPIPEGAAVEVVEIDGATAVVRSLPQDLPPQSSSA
ncbi:MAG: NfeD family protein [Actinomycetales bacterium]|nr:NfeD family protein [Actinomycetales bacterium]